ncbi:proteinase inhibitor [Bacillus altitudinis]|nr:proteinase inhibitor [Bacillus altitudinis]MBR3204904.1 proteinase inhibitor [Bacillus sp. (in: firmicutes)]MBU4619333.1 proteinase inhibitor [Bacillus sp. GG161]MBY0186593.1 proteinase inhibitor [Bacillus aerophilus]MBU8654219.1 proteinase inhibitor [Bacillus altitudinis]
MGEKTVVLTVDPVQKGSSVQFHMSLKNESDRDIEFTFNTSQKFELSVYDEDGNEKYRYSKDRMFTQAIQSFVLKADETYDFQDTWSNGVEPGTYEAVVTFKGKAEGLKQITEKKTFQVK